MKRLLLVVVVVGNLVLAACGDQDLNLNPAGPTLVTTQHKSQSINKPAGSTVSILD